MNGYMKEPLGDKLGVFPRNEGWLTVVGRFWMGAKEEQKQQDCLVFPTNMIMISVY